MTIGNRSVSRDRQIGHKFTRQTICICQWFLKANKIRGSVQTLNQVPIDIDKWQAQFRQCASCHGVRWIDWYVAYYQYQACQQEASHKAGAVLSIWSAVSTEWRAWTRHSRLWLPQLLHNHRLLWHLVMEMCRWLSSCQSIVTMNQQCWRRFYGRTMNFWLCLCPHAHLS